MADTEQLKALFNKYLNNACSAPEVEQLMGYFNLEDQGELHQLILNEIRFIPVDDKEEENQETLDRIFAKLRIQIQPDTNKVRSIWPRLLAAASVLLIVSIGVFLVVRKVDVRNYVATKTDHIQPGGNKAVLILGNGQRVSLTDSKNGTLAKQADKTIRKLTDGQIAYLNADTMITGAREVYNTIATPRGGQYQVTLADGTKVFLNALSSLRYPVNFNSRYRKVELTGEAYFEVAKDKQHPFIVTADQQEVQVLGTHFNIDSYTDEPAIRTTLVEGSVKVTTTANGRYRLLLPGQQSLISKGDIKVKSVDTEDALAWKNGYFMFDGEDIKTIMRKIARWYDLDVTYEGPVSQINFYGTATRVSEVSYILNMLERTGKVHFKLNGRRIIVSK